MASRASSGGLLLLLGLPALALSQAAAPPQEKAAEKPPAFPAGVELVTVDVVAVDKSGHAVAGLGRADFTVLEDGVPQAVSSFQAVALPPSPPGPSATPTRPRVSTNQGPEAQQGRTFLIVFDDIHLSPQLALSAKAAVGEFLKTGVRDGDRVGLVVSSGVAWWSARMPEGREELVAILKRLTGRYMHESQPDQVTPYEAMRIISYDDPDVAYQVQRRFDAYGTAGRERSGDRSYRDTTDRTSVVGLIDPYVRSRAADVYRQATERRRITMRTMTRALQSLSGVKGRKSMILVSGGFIYEPDFRDMKTLVDASMRMNVPIHFIDSRGLKALPDFMTAEYATGFDVQDTVAALADITREAEGSENVALDTGGLVVKNTNDLASGLTRVSNESLAYYLIGYTPTNTTRDGKFRKITVKLAPARAKGLRLRARRGYFAPEQGRSDLVAREGRGGSDPEIGRALDSPLERRELPLRVSAFSFDEASLNRVDVMISAEIGIGELQLVEQDGRMTGELAFLIEGQHRDTGEFFGVDEKIEIKILPENYKRMRLTGYTVTRQFALPAGSYQTKLVVRELGSGRIGSVIHDFDVPGLASFRLSTPVLSDALEERPAGATTPARPVLTVRRRFAPGSTLYVQYSVLGAAKDEATKLPRVSAGYEIRRQDGSVFKSAPQTQINPTSIGSLLRLNGIQLAGAVPGAYELVLKVKDELDGQQLEVREPFEIG